MKKTKHMGVAAVVIVLAWIVVSSTFNKDIPCEEAHLIALKATNNASWMQDHLSTLGTRKLSQLVLPASHDAAMYRRNLLGWGQTQCLSIYDQLSDGVRWLDLRPKWTNNKFVIHHGAINGPDLSEVLGDIKKFALKEHHELMLIKLSHFEGIDSAAYLKLVAVVNAELGSWLFKELPPAKRLANISLSEYVQSGTKILILVDGNCPIDHPALGIWAYADFNSPQVHRANLRVYDVYSNTTDFNRMSTDQFSKFEQFHGKCQDGETDCDLFLLSWTLTPKFRIWDASQPAIRNLKNSILKHPAKNSFGKVLNLIYVDFVGIQNVTEIAIAQNERLVFP